MRKVIAKTNKRFEALVALMKSWGFKLDVDDSDPDETGYFVTYRGKDLFAIDEDGVIFPAHGVSPKLDKVASALAKLPTSKIPTKGDELIATLGIGKKAKEEPKKQLRLSDGVYLVNVVTQDRTKGTYSVVVDGSQVIYTVAAGLIRMPKAAFFKKFQSFNVSDAEEDPEFALSLLRHAITKTKGL